jgi:hypothetical protein
MYRAFLCHSQQLLNRLFHNRKSSVIKILQVKSAIGTLSKMKDSINIMKQACPNVGP